ncbi:MAG: hypothetical protein M1837_001832 [Sclerophora amabilis]|nr:MAG: hypothetical protein M1837_001832 [Sclerophora amabilis]
MFRNLRAVLSLSRLPLTVQAHLTRDSTASPRSVQRIRFVQPLFTKRRAFNTALYGAAFLYGSVIFPAIALTLLEDDDDEQSHQTVAKSTHVHEKEDGGNRVTSSGEPPDLLTIEGSDDDTVFIPLGLVYKTRQKPYKGSDPEWQEYIRFSQDSQNYKRLQSELAGIVGHAVSKNSRLHRSLGNPVKVRQSWLDIQFPYAPPPQYERSGLEINDAGFAWTTRTVTLQNYARLRRTLFPRSISYSFLAFFNVLWSSQVDSFKKIWGSKSSNGHDISTIIGDPEDMKQGNPKQRQLQQDVNAFSDHSSSARDPPGSNSRGYSPQANFPNIQSLTSKNGALTPNPPLPQSSGQLNSAIGAFKQTFASTWSPLHFDIPRGSILVSGLVEINGSRAMSSVDVTAAYNPKTRQWAAVSIRLRSFREKTQKPKG